MNIRVLFLIVVALVVCVLGARGWAASAESNVTAVDTRTLTMTQLTVTGPTSFAFGLGGTFTATLQYQGVAAQDVTAECKWSVSGGPPITESFDRALMSGNVLVRGVASPVPYRVTASVTRPTGQIVSAPVTVTITESNPMEIRIEYLSPSTNGPVYARPAGTGNFTWRLAARATGLAADKPGVTFQWTLNGQPFSTARSFDTEITASPGERELKLVASDGPTRSGRVLRYAIFDAPPGPGEPPALVPAVDPGFGDVLMEDVNALDTASDGTVPFAFDPLKTPNGLIVITHGLYAQGDNQWLWKMARTIRQRLEAESKPVPNIAIFDWGRLSNPTEYWGYEEARDKALIESDRILLGISLLAVATPVEFVADLILVRPHGQSQGQELADWIQTEIGNGNIEQTEAIHLIGHSAGGFVLGECGWQIRNITTDLRVTMLDTPLPLHNSAWNYPGTGRKLERYVSSFFGTLQYPSTLLATLDDRYAILLNPWSPAAGPVIPTLGAHSYAYQWYHGTITDSAASDGFARSPFMTNPPPAPDAGSGDSLTLSAPPPPPPTDTTVPITGFTTFGAVAPDASGFILTEGTSLNAGVVRAAYSFPPGTHSLRFAFRFTTPGDGDFLSVSFGDFPLIFTGKDMPLTRDGELTVDVPVEHLAGDAGDLVFRLVSRGQQNATVTIHDLVAVTVEDADNDGLSNAAEAAQGTSAMSADTDGDGVSDAAEVNLHLTSPLRADTDGDGPSDGAELAAGTDPKNPLSRLAITATAFAPTGFSLQWSSQPVRNYRVLRSPTPGFESYTVPGAVLSNASPTQSFLDTTLLPGPAAGMFYRIELAP